MKKLMIRDPVWFLICLILPVLVGAISGLLTKTAMVQYASFRKPPLSPPGWLFPVAWTILYLLMGYASYRIITADHAGMVPRLNAMTVYLLQLIFNFAWSVIFFNFGNYLVAFIWLMILWGLIIFSAILFYRIDRTAGLLMIPYIGWTTFAAYLNLATLIMSRSPAGL